MTEGILGGFRYVFTSVNADCYDFSCTMFWRSESSSVSEEPGTMLVDLDTNSERTTCHVVAFQTFDLPEAYSFRWPSSRKSVTWKLASKPSRQLIERYDCLVPEKTLQNIFPLQDS